MSCEFDDVSTYVFFKNLHLPEIVFIYKNDTYFETSPYCDDHFIN